MADVFFNLATQSLSSSSGGIQPLILPLFAPAPSLVPDIALLPSGDQPPLVGETAPSSILPEIIADEMTDAGGIEPPSRESISTDPRPVLPNLIPSGVPEHPISTVSIRDMLRSQLSMRKNLEPAMPAPQPPAPASTADESMSEERDAFSFQTDSPVEADVLRPAVIHQPMPAPARETIPPDSVVDTQPTMQPLLSVSLPSPQPSPQPEQRGNAGAMLAQQPLSSQSTTIHPSDQQPVVPPPGGDSAIKPLPNQPVRQGRKSEWSEDEANGLFTSAAKPVVQPVINPEVARPAMMPAITSVAPDLVQTPVTSLTVPAQNVMPVVSRHVNQEMQNTAAERNGKPDEPITSMELAERVSNPPASPFPTASAILHVQPVVAKHGADTAGEEFETPPVRVTIGRVVVRATPTAAPAPTQKRALRPALSLSEYLKQRERGSR